MKYPSQFLSALVYLILAQCISSYSHAAGPNAAPASVTKEGDLVIVTLTPEGEQRLRLEVAKLEHRTIPEFRLFSGEVVIPLNPSAKNLTPLLNGNPDTWLQMADLQTAADGRVTEAAIRLENATIAMDRAQKARASEAGSQRALDDAKAAHEIAAIQLKTETARRSLLGKPIELNQAQTFSEKWVRVSIYSGEIIRLSKDRNALITSIGGSEKVHEALRVIGPISANPVSNTVDWFYQLPKEAEFSVGQRVSVSIQTEESQIISPTVPTDALLYDIHGGQWVYEQTKPHVFTRRRIQVLRVLGDQAVLKQAPPESALIVTKGATELFGTEFLTGK